MSVVPFVTADGTGSADKVENCRTEVRRLAAPTAMLRGAVTEQICLLESVQDEQQRQWEYASKLGLQGCPIVLVYMSDGWSCSQIYAEVEMMPNGKRIRRDRRCRTEYSLERALLKAVEPTGDVRAALKSTMPKPLPDKSGATICAASLSTGLLRMDIQTGIVQTLYLQDGLHVKRFLAMQAARHDHFYAMDVLELESDDANWELNIMD